MRVLTAAIETAAEIFVLPLVVLLFLLLLLVQTLDR